MKLFAISDLHLGHEENRAALDEIRPRPDDWLVIAGDVGEHAEHLAFAFEALGPKFRQLVWVPGNHELWARPGGDGLRGVARYERLVAECRRHGVITPEDPYPVETFGGVRVRLVPMFLLYDYSFRPAEIPLEGALDWARETGIVCADELWLRPDPHPSRIAWCEARVAQTRARLEAFDDGLPTVLVNHWPLRADRAFLPRIPRFSLWCGTIATEDWHLRFRARAVISGHLHIQSTAYRDGVRFDEVSLGYPRQWVGRREPDACVREIPLRG